MFLPCDHELACIIHTTQKQSTLESRGSYLDSEELVFGAEELDGVKIEVDVQCFASRIATDTQPSNNVTVFQVETNKIRCV